MFKRYAVITTSAKILGRVLATDIDIAKIRDYFIDYHAHTVSERSLADKAIEVITQFVAQNRGKFSDDKALKNMMENYGLIALKMIISKSKSLRLYLKICWQSITSKMLIMS